jgi:16S rRNA (cytosine967-C5)-methyltransferase
MFAKAYLDTALLLLERYTGAEPFHLYLKQFFAANKKFGSRDRKQITQLCYSLFRAGHALKHLEKEQQVVYALFLCSEAPNPLVKYWDEQLFADAAKSLDEKLQIVAEGIGFDPAQLFPWNGFLSAEIDQRLFQRSLLVQPHVYLRLRPGKERVVRETLQRNAIAFEKITDTCIAVSNSTKADAVLQLDRDAVVQDLNSQKVVDLLKEHGGLKKFTAWDCCAASGGKSLLLLDTFSNVHIIVSDVRERILYNLRARFQKAGVKSYQWFVGNAATDAPPHGQLFDVILCDVPCSGSGTWSRTPEQLHYFKTEKIEGYAQLQKSIVANASRYLKPGGLLLYSTCSVFEAENEAVVQYISEQYKLAFLESAYYKGYDKRADTLFAALFQAL